MIPDMDSTAPEHFDERHYPMRICCPACGRFHERVQRTTVSPTLLAKCRSCNAMFTWRLDGGRIVCVSQPAG
jgi:hypothetical protein